jgi:hypothetical protein
MGTGLFAALFMVGSWPARPASQSAARGNPAAFFQPAVTLDASERRRLDAGEVVVKMLPARGTETAIFSAALVGDDVDGERLLAWVRQIAELKKSAHVPAIARFSQPPQLADLATLSLDDEDLEAIRTCRPKACDIKLSEAEIDQLRKTIVSAGVKWKGAVQDAYRAVILARAQRFLAGGLSASSPYHDQGRPVTLDAEFAAILKSSPFLATRLPHVAEFLGAYPRAAGGGIESFLYWSKESLGARPVVIITHVTLTRGGTGDVPSAVVVAQQVYASHYMTGALAVTTITGEAGGPRYLMYLNRSRIDVLDGFFGGLVRRIVGGRLRTEASSVVGGLRLRLQRPPP